MMAMSSASAATSSASSAGAAELVFEVHCETEHGTEVCAVGSSAELGSWTPMRALQLKTDAATYPKWSGTARLKADASYEFKFVKLDAWGSPTWEDGPNRQFILDAHGNVSSAAASGSRSRIPRFGIQGGAPPKRKNVPASATSPVGHAFGGAMPSVSGMPSPAGAAMLPGMPPISNMPSPAGGAMPPVGSVPSPAGGAPWTGPRGIPAASGGIPAASAPHAYPSLTARSAQPAAANAPLVKTDTKDLSDVAEAASPSSSLSSLPAGGGASALSSEDEVRFEVVCSSTDVGDVLRLVGSCPELGVWDVTRGLKLSTTAASFPIWHASCIFSRKGSIDWKLVIQRAAGTQDWEPHANRTLSLPSSHRGPWKVRVEFSRMGSSLESVRPGPPTTTSSGPSGPEMRRAVSELPPKFYPPPSPSAPMTSAALPMSTATRKGAIATQREERFVVTRSASPQQGPSHNPACQRSSSFSLLSEVPTCAGLWLRKKDEGPPPKEQVFILKLPELTEEEADELNVEVAFQGRRRISMKRTGWIHEGGQAIWTLSFSESHLDGGLHFFHFLVNGVYTLSKEHFAINGWNAAIFSESIRRYILHATQTAPDEDLPQGNRPRMLSELAFDSKVGGGGSAAELGLKVPGQKAGNLARPYSICGNLAGLNDSDDEEPKEDSGAGSSFASFAKAVFEGLFEGELRLRIDGFVLPEAPQLPAEVVTTRPDYRGGQGLRLWAAEHMIKKQQGACEDAYFVDPHGLGVADGVGCMVQYASYGINAADYAAELMSIAQSALERANSGVNGDAEEPPEARAAQALRSAENSAQAYGASTISVLSQKGDRIGVANLGDSGFMVLRKGPRGMQVVHRSEEQQHSWNCPYQLTRLPPALLKKFPKLSLDTADDCQKWEATIQQGDLVLLFTDGLSDNLHDRELLHIVDRALSPAFGDLVGLCDLCTPPKAIAKALALAAQERSLDPTAKVPFVEYSKRHGFECLGGKQDDITVVAAWVVIDWSQDYGGPETLDLAPHLAEAKARKAAEDAKRAEEEEKARREIEAARLAEEEKKRAAEAAKLAEEERIRKEAEAARQAEEEKKRADEAAKQAEEERIRREAEAAKQAEEEKLRKEAEAAKQPEEAKQAEEEERRKEAEAAKQAEEEKARVAEETARREEEEEKERREAEAKRAEEEQAAKSAEPARKAEEEKAQTEAEAAKQAEEDKAAKAAEAARQAQEEKARMEAEAAKQAEEEKFRIAAEAAKQAEDPVAAENAKQADKDKKKKRSKSAKSPDEAKTTKATWVPKTTAEDGADATAASPEPAGEAAQGSAETEPVETPVAKARKAAFNGLHAAPRAKQPVFASSRRSQDFPTAAPAKAKATAGPPARRKEQRALQVRAEIRPLSSSKA